MSELAAAPPDGPDAALASAASRSLPDLAAPARSTRIRPAPTPSGAPPASSDLSRLQGARRRRRSSSVTLSSAVRPPLLTGTVPSQICLAPPNQTLLCTASSSFPRGEKSAKSLLPYILVPFSTCHISSSVDPFCMYNIPKWSPRYALNYIPLCHVHLSSS